MKGFFVNLKQTFLVSLILFNSLYSTVSQDLVEDTLEVSNSVITTHGVIAELHKTFDMYLLLDSIQDTFIEQQEVVKKKGMPAQDIVKSFDIIHSEYIMKEKISRALASDVNQEKQQAAGNILDLANQSRPPGQAIQEIATIVNDPQVNEAAQVVASFAVSMANADYQQMPNEPASVFIIRTFINVFEIAFRSGVIKAVPVLIHAVVHTAGAAADLGKGAVKGVRSHGCCILS